MNTIDEMIEVLLAVKAGKKIQKRYIDSNKPSNTTAPYNWKDEEFGVSFNFVNYEYRITPEPKTVIRKWRFLIVNDSPFISVYLTNEEVIARYGTLKNTRIETIPESAKNFAVY